MLPCSSDSCYRVVFERMVRSSACPILLQTTCPNGCAWSRCHPHPYVIRSRAVWECFTMEFPIICADVAHGAHSKYIYPFLFAYHHLELFFPPLSQYDSLARLCIWQVVLDLRCHSFYGTIWHPSHWFKLCMFVLLIFFLCRGWGEGINMWY